jgi:hypothetical protein
MARFTSANAREMADKGREARRQRLLQLRQTIDTLVESPTVDFHAKRLARVRVQLDRIDSELERCSLSDSKRIRDLTDAQLRLSEQERILAGRPLPGSRRPGREVRSAYRPSTILEVAPPQQPAPARPMVADP